MKSPHPSDKQKEKLKIKTEEIVRKIEEGQYSEVGEPEKAIMKLLTQQRKEIVSEVKKIDQELENSFVKMGSSDEFLKTVGVWRSNFMHKLRSLK